MNFFDLKKTQNEFDALFSGEKRLLIVLHNNPDPDALASAFALSHLVRELYNVPSALAYGIRSETQDLGRETSSRDIKAYLSVLPKASMRKLAKISHPKLPRSYFVVLTKALERAMSFRNLICAHLGDIPAPEIVAEIADVLLRLKRIGWSMCTGRYKGDLVISLRSSNPKAKAGKIIKRMVPDPKYAGGHDTVAGGKIELSGLKKYDIVNLENNLSQEFAQLLGYEKIDWKPVLD